MRIGETGSGLYFVADQWIDGPGNICHRCAEIPSIRRDISRRVLNESDPRMNCDNCCGAIPPRAPLHDESGAVVGSVDTSAVVPVHGTPEIVAMPSLDCPNCARPRRERGEVRVHFWACGCAVQPSAVERRKLYPLASSELNWRALGEGATAWHPTREGAIAAWREALAEAQRREDERAAAPAVLFDGVGEYARHGAPMSQSLTGIDYGEASTSEIVGVATHAAGPDELVTINVYHGGFVTEADAARAAARAIGLAGARKATEPMPAAQSAELVRATVPAVDIEALPLEALCELATDLAKRYPERMRQWERRGGMHEDWTGTSWLCRPSTVSNGAIIERCVKWNGGIYSAASDLLGMRELVRHLAGEVA